MAGATPGTLLSRASDQARDLAEGRRRAGTGDGVNLAHGAAVRETWIHLAAALIAARALWTGGEPEWDAAVGRATERIASSLVYADPARFAAEACADYAARVVVDAATGWLDDALAPDDRVSGDDDPREFIWEGLLEAASSGLVGAWVESRSG